MCWVTVWMCAPHPVQTDTSALTADGQVFLGVWLRTERREARALAFFLTVCLFVAQLTLRLKHTVATTTQTLARTGWMDKWKDTIHTVSVTNPHGTSFSEKRTMCCTKLEPKSVFKTSVYLQTLPGLRWHWTPTGSLALKQHRSVSLCPTSHSSPSSTIWFPQMGWSLTGQRKQRCSKAQWIHHSSVCFKSLTC